jgi:hypothetical protein
MAHIDVNPLLSIEETLELGVTHREDSLTARFARGSFILTATKGRDLPLALWRAVRPAAALACHSGWTEGRVSDAPRTHWRLPSGIASDRRERAIRALYCSLQFYQY